MKINEVVNVEEDLKSKALAGAITLGTLAGGYLGTRPAAAPHAHQPTVQARDFISDDIPNLSGTRMEDVARKKAKAAGIHGIELAQFLAQAFHESQGFTATREKGTPKYFAARYDPTRAPATAKKLGNTRPGDGERFRGAGPLQVTGKYWFSQAEKDLGLPLTKDPNLSSNPDIGIDLAIWYWKKKVRPAVSDFSDTRAVTRQINSGLDKLDRREQIFDRYIEAMK